MSKFSFKPAKFAGAAIAGALLFVPPAFAGNGSPGGGAQPGAPSATGTGTGTGTGYGGTGGSATGGNGGSANGGAASSSASGSSNSGAGVTTGPTSVTVNGQSGGGYAAPAASAIATAPGNLGTCVEWDSTALGGLSFGTASFSVGGFTLPSYNHGKTNQKCLEKLQQGDQAVAIINGQFGVQQENLRQKGGVLTAIVQKGTCFERLAVLGNTINLEDPKFAALVAEACHPVAAAPAHQPAHRSPPPARPQCDCAGKPPELKPGH